MPDLSLICPHCDTKLEAGTEMLGHTIECPACRAPLTLPRFAPRTTSPGGVPPLPTRRIPQDGLAIVSLCLGVCALVMGPFGFLPALPAVIVGGISERRIRRTPDRISGKAMARVGRILGYVSLVISVLCFGSCMFFY